MHCPNLTFHGGEAIRHVWLAARKQNPRSHRLGRASFGLPQVCEQLTNNPTSLVSSLKGEVKKKHNRNGWIFSCFAAHLFEQDLF
jgi:hypothetical protein